MTDVALQSDHSLVPKSDWHTSAFSETNGWSGSLGAYDSLRGRVGVSFDPVFHLFRLNDDGVRDRRSDVRSPYGFGSLVATGDGAMRVWLTPLGAESFALEINSTGSAPNRSLGFRWADGFEQSAGEDTGRLINSIAATPIDRVFGRNGTRMALEGRASEHGQGQFMSHQWSLHVAPLGSTAQVVDAASTRPSFTPDVTGDYLFKLQVNDGTNRSSTYLLLQSVGPLDGSPGKRDSTTVDFNGGTGGPFVGQVGQELVLDGRRVFAHWDPRLDFAVQPVWSIYHEGQYIVSQAPGPVLRFIPPKTGWFEAMLHGAGSSTAGAYMKIPFGVGEHHPRILSPYVTIAGLGRSYLDIDGDGDVDVVGAYGDATGYARLRSFHRIAGGHFEERRSTLAYLTPPGFHMRFNDVSGDGRVDFIRDSMRSTEVAIQRPDGDYAAWEILQDPCPPSFYNVFFLGAVDMDANGRDDIVRVVRCIDGTETMVYNPSNANGTFGAPVTIPSMLDERMFGASTSADLDGDGVRESMAAAPPMDSPTRFRSFDGMAQARSSEAPFRSHPLTLAKRTDLPP